MIARFLTLFFCACVTLLSAGEVKYVFLLIGDGFGPSQRIVAELGAERRLSMNTLPVNTLMGTDTYDGKTTDSAASGTAIACGEKTSLYSIGMDPDGRALESLASKLKRVRGFSVGIFSSCGMTDATPASFYAHRRNRAMYPEIAEDMMNSPFDLFGGFDIFESPDIPNRAELEKEWRRKLVKAGFEVITGPDALKNIRKGVRTYVACPPHVRWTRTGEKKSISLADYVEKASALFESDPDGFFIMAEGGRIDHAGHNNDSAMTLREVIAFDEAVAAALEFQKKHPEETLIVITADHETGILKIEDMEKLRKNVSLLWKQPCQMEEFEPVLRAALQKKQPAAGIIAMLEKFFGIPFVAEERNWMGKYIGNVYTPQSKKCYRPSAMAFLKKAASFRDSRIGIRYHSGGHSSFRVPLNASGPGCELFLQGPMENSSLRSVIESILEEKRAGLSCGGFKKTASE